MKISIFWFRRDLRLHDNNGLYQALRSGFPVLPIYIFDSNYFSEGLNDQRATYVYKTLLDLQKLELDKAGRGLHIFVGNPLDVLKSLLEKYEVETIYANEEFEPGTLKRDEEIGRELKNKGVSFQLSLDHLIQHPSKIKKADGSVYQVFTPYSKQWRSQLTEQDLKEYPSEDLLKNLLDTQPDIPSMEDIGCPKKLNVELTKKVPKDRFRNYENNRDQVAINGTSRLSVHLRNGTISVRKLFKHSNPLSEKYTTELIWREFYASILFHHPRVVNHCFRENYEQVPWRKNEEDLNRWKQGITGIPMVDAGMRELNETGLMHNRVRMIVSSFLTKNLMMDWRLGEAYFAEKLLDYDLASNNGGWQWAAGCGVDAAPYFRVFNPESQQERYDPQKNYIKYWVKEFGTRDYPSPMVNLKDSRKKCIQIYKEALNR